MSLCVLNEPRSGMTFRASSGNVAAITLSANRGNLIFSWSRACSEADTAECEDFSWRVGIQRRPSIRELISELWLRCWE